MPKSPVLFCKACGSRVQVNRVGRPGHWCHKCKMLLSSNGVRFGKPKEEAAKAAKPQPAATPTSKSEGTSPAQTDTDGDAVAESAVTSIRGIGAATAKKLAEQGIKSVADLAQAIKDGKVEDPRIAEVVADHLKSQQK